MVARGKKSKRWRYSAGERGRNRVRVFERPKRGDVLMQWAEVDPAGVLRQRSKSLGQCTREAAKAKADEVAARFAALPRSAQPKPLTLKTLFDTYEREVSRHKGYLKQLHDRACAGMFVKLFGADREPQTLSRREWDQFIIARRRGTIRPRGAHRVRKGVGERQIQYDLKHLLAVLNWSTVAGDGRGGMLLERNPLKGFPLPREESPQRPIVTAEQYTKLREAARARGLPAETMLVLVHDTGHRIGAVRGLMWSDIDLTPGAEWIRWRAQLDKIGHAHTTPIAGDAATLLTALRAAQKTIGDLPVFVVAGDPTACITRHQTRKLWDALAAAAGLPKGQRFGWHSLRRQFATEMKGVPLPDLAALGGWKSTATILQCYQQPDVATQRTALAERKALQAGGLSG